MELFMLLSTKYKLITVNLFLIGKKWIPTQFYTTTRVIY